MESPNHEARSASRPVQFSLQMLFWLTFDVGMAVAYLGILVEVITALERRGTLPRYIIASALLLAVIVGNLLARRWVR